MKEIDWSNLSFGYMKTDYNVRCYYRNGALGEIEVCSVHCSQSSCNQTRCYSNLFLSLIINL